MDKKDMIWEDGFSRCPKCGKATERFVEMPSFDGTNQKIRMKVHVMCECQEKERLRYELELQKEEEMRQIESLRRYSLMDSKLRGVNLSSFTLTEENERLHKIVRNYIDKFDVMLSNNQGLLLYGTVGTGKSYASAVIANELLDKKISVVMTSFVKLLDKSKDEDISMDRLSQVKLLIIDDLGAERSTDFALEKVYNIIDNRYRSNKPVILTTNLTIEQMKKCEDIRYSRIYDRIFEMCYPVKVEGTSWRKKEAKERFYATKKLLEE